MERIITMTERKKLELQINQPTAIELLYDDPIVGESQYGPYYMYAVKSNGDEYAFFAPKDVHSELKSLNRGDTALVTKLAEQRGKKIVTEYTVEPDESKQVIDEGVKSKPDINEVPMPKIDYLYDLMLQSYQDAFEIQEELNGLVDVGKIAITLFIARSKTPYNGNGH